MQLLWKWELFAVFNSLVIFFGCYWTFGEGILDPGNSNEGMWAFGVLVYTVVIITVNLKIALEIK